jgi:hypothetical protein
VTAHSGIVPTDSGIVTSDSGQAPKLGTMDRNQWARWPGIPTHTEIDFLNRLVKDSKRSREALPLSRNLEKIAQLGGYLARTNDPPPGITVMWRYMRRLADMQLGFNLACERYG